MYLVTKLQWNTMTECGIKAKKGEIETKISKAVPSELLKCDKNTILYCKCSDDLFLCYVWFECHKVERVTNFYLVTN